MKTFIQTLVAGSLLSLVVHAYPQDDTIIKTYPLVISDTNSVIEAVKAITTDKAKIYYYHPNNELIISATSNQHCVITALLKEINVPSPNVQVDVVFLQTGQATDFAFGSTPEHQPKVSRKGNTFQFDISPRIQGQSTSIMNNNSQRVVVKNGKQASVFMGTAVPFYLWLIDFAVKWEYINIIEQKFEMKQVGSSLMVEPHILNHGPLISVILTPEVSGIIDGKPHRLQFTRIATEVTVSSGQPVTIGNFGKNSEFYNKFLVGIDRNGNNQSIQVRLTATILPTATPR